MNIRQQSGFSLIEAVFFMVIISVLIVSLYAMFDHLLGSSHNITSNNKALYLAEYGNEFVIGQKRHRDFSQIYNPCSGPLGCEFGQQKLIITITPNWQGNPAWSLVTSQVSGAGSATLSTVIANY